jgi:ATP-binding cassette, subfamily B, bacterial
MKPIIKIIKTTWKFWPYYVATGLLVVVISLLNLANPIINKEIVDVIVNNVQNNSSNFTKLVYLLVLIVAFDVLITLITNITGYLGDRLGQKLNSFLTGKFYQHVLNLEIEFFDNEQSGKIMNKLQRGIDNIAQFISNMLNNFLPFFLTALFTVVFLAFYSWEIAVLLAILFPLYVLISERSSRTWIAQQGEVNQIQDSAFGRVLEAINSIRVVKSFVSEHLEFSSYKKKREQIEELAKKQSFGWHKFDIYRRLVLNIVLSGIYVYVIYHTYNGRYSIAEMILLLQLVQQARFPLFAMSFILGQIQQASAGSKDFFEVLDQKTKINDKAGATVLQNIEGSIAFTNVSFTYDQNKNVLNNISFALKRGEKLALVGESGGGKSTIANLLLRFYEPQSGAISIDGVNIQDVTQHSLHQNIGVVLQDSLLFSGTVMENIRYGQPAATDEAVIEAARAANAYDFISSFPNGFQSEIGEKGVKLSGGQKQRLSIARAILKDAPILVLDEATSALDSKAEQEVQKALNKLMEGRTTIIIAHRLATIKSVNHIIVLKDGAISEEGSPKELANQGGIYAELLRLQSTIQPSTEEEETRLKEFDIAV